LIAGRTVQLGLVVAAWLARSGVIAVVAAGAAVQILLASLSIHALRASCDKPPRFDRALLGRWLRDGVRLHANYLSDLLLTNASVLIINYYLGARATGLYHTALALLAVPMVLPQAAAMVMLGRLGTAGRVETWREQRRHLVVLVALALVGVAACLVLTPVLVPLVLGSRFAESTRLLQLLSLTFVSGTVFRVMHPQWIARGLFTTMSLVTFSMGLVNVAGHWLLVPRFETMGAAASLLASHAFGLGAQLWLILRCERELAGPLQPAQTVP
jgi:O-antigen/teichoic acid export membrane protein